MKQNKKEVCAIILARSGSKGLKNKNLRDLDGKPLISFTINDAKKSKYINKIIVSTDSKEIAKVANEYGAETPFLRPRELSSDLVTSEESLRHALTFLNEQENYFPDIVLYLQITEPFRPKNIIDDCIECMLDNDELDSVFAGHIKHKNYWEEKNGNFIRISRSSQSALPRQIKNPVFREDTGIALATKSRVVLSGLRIGKNVKIIPYESDFGFIDIHSSFDLQLSNLIKKNMNKLYE